MEAPVQGFVRPGLERVRQVFAANFDRDDGYRELGASLVAYRDGECVIDLWGGWRDAERRIPWTADTLVNIWSATKGLAAIAVAMLVDEGRLDYGRRVSDYWPEYGCNGKEDTLVSHIMSHQAGLPGFEEPTPLEDFYNWSVVTERLARQAPMWAPGEKNSYHAMTYGFLAGELVRRASGLTPGEFLARRMAGPLGADAFIGLPEREEHRVAPLVPSVMQRDFEPAAMPREAVVAVTNPDMSPTLPNRRDWRAAQIPAGNGHASAKGLARLYAALANGGELDGVRLMSPATIARLCELQTDRVDILLGMPAMWRQGLSGNVEGMYGPLPTTVGHSGWGGSFGCFDPDRNVAIGYVLNQMGDRTVGDPRGSALCQAIFDGVL
ncbi:MAG: beta-lactamase family protein [Proteobacteria bacterium]|nr:beta-lactamase family protein [Pseudomonadota bacterium]